MMMIRNWRRTTEKGRAKEEGNNQRKMEEENTVRKRQERRDKMKTIRTWERRKRKD